MNVKSLFILMPLIDLGSLVEAGFLVRLDLLYLTFNGGDPLQLRKETLEQIPDQPRGHVTARDDLQVEPNTFVPCISLP